MGFLIQVRQIVFTGSIFRPEVTYGLVEGLRRYKIEEKRGLMWVYRRMRQRFTVIGHATTLADAMVICKHDNSK